MNKKISKKDSSNYSKTNLVTANGKNGKIHDASKLTFLGKGSFEKISNIHCFNF